MLRDLIIFIGNLNAVREQEKLAGMKDTDERDVKTIRIACILRRLVIA